MDVFRDGSTTPRQTRPTAAQSSALPRHRRAGGRSRLAVPLPTAKFSARKAVRDRAHGHSDRRQRQTAAPTLRPHRRRTKRRQAVDTQPAAVSQRASASLGNSVMRMRLDAIAMPHCHIGRTRPHRALRSASSTAGRIWTTSRIASPHRPPVGLGPRPVSPRRVDRHRRLGVAAAVFHSVRRQRESADSPCGHSPQRGSSDPASARHSLRGTRLAVAAARRFADARPQRRRARSVSGSMKFEMRMPRRASMAV